jgi:carbon storage regulator
MLVLRRKLNQTILIGQDVVVTVLGFEGNEVKLGIDAPHSVAILRQEIVQDVKKENLRAARTSSPAALRRLAALTPQCVTTGIPTTQHMGNSGEARTDFR